MENRNWASIVLGLGAVACIVVILFSAVRLPVMKVVRQNIQSGVDADAYFYSDVEDFEKHEAAVAEKRLHAEPVPEP